MWKDRAEDADGAGWSLGGVRGSTALGKALWPTSILPGEDLGSRDSFTSQWSPGHWVTLGSWASDRDSGLTLLPSACSFTSCRSTPRLSQTSMEVKIFRNLQRKICCSVTHSCLTLLPHRLQHTRLPCPSPSPGVCSNSCPLNQWCHPTISSSVTPFSSYPQSFPASGSFPVSQLFTSGGQSIGAAALTSVLPMNIQDWFPLGLTGLISFLSRGLSGVFSNSSKTSILQHSAFFMVQLSTSIHDYWKNHSFD